MDKFEKLIKNSVENYEAPYSESAWLAMSKKLGPEKGGIGKWAIGGTIAAAVIIFGVWYLLPSEKLEFSNTTVSSVEAEKSPVQNTHLQKELIENNVAEEKLADDFIPTENENHTAKADQQTHTKEVNESAIPDADNVALVSPVQNINVSNGLNNIDPQEEKPLSNITTADEKVDFSKFKLSAVADKLQVCVGEEVNFSPSIPKLKALYQWEFEGREFNAGPYTSRQFDKAGDYTVCLNLLDSKTNEIVNKSKSITIHVNPLPQNEIAYEFDNTAVPRVNFKQKNAFVTEVNWDIIGLHKTSKATFSYDFKQKGNYVVSCKVKGQNGCESTANTMVNIENNYNLLAPNAFTPNGDNLNESFIPKALLITTTPFIMTIYDKSGKLVFETNDASRPWDGLYTKDLTPAPSGSYVWVVQLTNEDNKIESYQGQVTITR